MDIMCPLDIRGMIDFFHSLHHLLRSLCKGTVPVHGEHPSGS